MSEHPHCVHNISDFEQYLNIIKTEPCVVKFTATWCGPCKRMAPAFAKAAYENHETANFIEIDIDSAGKITNYENVQSIPLFLFYKDGLKQDMLSISGQNVGGLEASVKKFITHVKMSALSLDDIVEYDSSDEEHDSDVQGRSVHDEYGEDFEVPAEKTMPEKIVDGIIEGIMGSF